jgi:hypothetical protein
MIEQLPIEFSVRGSEERLAVLRVLQLIRPRRGREAALSMHAIAEETGFKTRLIQAIVKFLVEERHWPIGSAMSAPFGYFWIATNDERRVVRNHFVRRALSNMRHASAFDTDSIVAPLVGQIEINFPEVKQ